MPHTLIIGDGPGGLSAALFLAKNGLDVVVCGQDNTAMHAALLKNYLGVEQLLGTDFQTIARNQVEQVGAVVRDVRVETLSRSNQGFVATLGDGETVTAKYLVLSEGKNPRLALGLGLERDANGAIPVDVNGLSAIPGVYVVGRAARPGRSQAIISAGDGAAAAIDILSREKGQDFADWDAPAST